MRFLSLFIIPLLAVSVTAENGQTRAAIKMYALKVFDPVIKLYKAYKVLRGKPPPLPPRPTIYKQIGITNPLQGKDCIKNGKNAWCVTVQMDFTTPLECYEFDVERKVHFCTVESVKTKWKGATYTQKVITELLSTADIPPRFDTTACKPIEVGPSMNGWPAVWEISFPEIANHHSR